MSGIFSVDFEYNDPVEGHMGLMAVAYQINNETPKSVWLYNCEESKSQFAEILKKNSDKYMVAYNVDAEAKCFISLGLDPTTFKWLDLYADHIQLCNQDYRYMYGKYIDKYGFEKESRPIRMPDEYMSPEDWDTYKSKREFALRSKGLTNEPLTINLVNSLYNLCGIKISTSFKNDTRDLILEKKEKYTEKEVEQILEYAKEDIVHLPTLNKKLQFELESVLKLHNKTRREILAIREYRARVVAYMAMVEKNGIPIDKKRFHTLSKNIPHIKAKLMFDFNVEVAPVYQMGARTYPPPFRFTGYKKKSNEIFKIIDNLKLGDKKWPLSEKSKNYKLDDKTLKEFETFPTIKKLRKTNNIISSLGAFTVDTKELSDRRKKGKKSFQDYIDSQWISHPDLRAWGTQTGRNAHKSSSLIFAQSAWMRSIVNPPPGWVVCESDFSSQEILIGAALSGDRKLIAAYNFSDPYLAFGFDAKYIPIKYKKLPISELKTKFAAKRKILKAVVLGLSYGMRGKSLAFNMTLNTGNKVSIEEAESFIKLHEETYSKYYAWRQKVIDVYSHRPLLLRNGWYLGTDNPNKLSVQNFPVQGTGAHMIHESMMRAIDRDIRVVCTMHDALFWMCREDEFDTKRDVVEEAMIEASDKVLGYPGMRVGHEHICNGDYWVVDKVSEDQKFLIEYCKHDFHEMGAKI